MIYDKLESASKYTFASASLMKALEDLVMLKAEKLETPYFKRNMVEFTTVAIEEKQAEYHRKYIDIHVVLEGSEYVEVGHITELECTEPFDEVNDIGFGHLNTAAKFQGYLQPGYFLVCFPEDAHLVGAHLKGQESVKKLVYKISVE